MSVAERQPKAIRVIAGLMLMASVMLVAISLVTRYAGAWGVPFFTFTSERGSPCKNNLTGYTCDPLNLADLEYYADLDLPDTTRVLEGVYTATHDYQLQAKLRVPKAQATKAAAALAEAFGGCRRNRPLPSDVVGLRSTCVRANDDAVARTSEPASRLWTVGSGVAKDGSYVVTISIKSR